MAETAVIDMKKHKDRQPSYLKLPLCQSESHDAYPYPRDVFQHVQTFHHCRPCRDYVIYDDDMAVLKTRQVSCDEASDVVHTLMARRCRLAFCRLVAQQGVGDYRQTCRLADAAAYLLALVETAHFPSCRRYRDRQEKVAVGENTRRHVFLGDELSGISAQIGVGLPVFHAGDDAVHGVLRGIAEGCRRTFYRECSPKSPCEAVVVMVALQHGTWYGGHATEADVSLAGQQPFVAAEACIREYGTYDVIDGHSCLRLCG